MSESILNAALRTGTGKADANRLRRTGAVPCNVYGIEKDTVICSVNRRELDKVLSQGHSVIVLNLGGKEQQTVVKEIQYHPVKGTVIHVDFQRLKAGTEVTVDVPIHFAGNAPGVKAGGVFQENRAELNITCLPKNLPDNIQVDISKMEIGDSIHVRDLNIEGVTINDDEDLSICSIQASRKATSEFEGEEGEESDEEAEPEVISKSKKDEDEG